MSCYFGDVENVFALCIIVINPPLVGAYYM